MALSLFEQPDDWTEPGAHPVVGGVYRIPLGLPLDGLTAVNVYVIEDAGGLVLIDSGWARPETEKALGEAVQSLGHRLEDIDQIIVTHAHWDHYTQALALRESLGSRVRVGWEERHTIEAFDLADGVWPRQVVLLRECGAPELAARVAAVPVGQSDRDMPFGPPDGWLRDGERIALTDRHLDIRATPGHTRGHVVIGDPVGGLLFSGDHVLPHITPSLGFERSPEKYPLRSYLASLRLMRQSPDALLLPAHGPVTRSVHTRVEQLVAHHEERLDEVLRQVSSGADTAHAVARALPWTRRRRRLDDLPLVHQMTAVLEIDAHLDVLAQHDAVSWQRVDGIRRFAPAA
ncbi:MBL fold metallo-hydrolase [Streptomyces fuscichromogenes]|uniref:MBL fold metallo-hydrolase n=1 Tax=Streptomyces fuscichromogenes TaxID=1324013 RepID=A0A917XFH0_9ACTN|nr:MBL fold metallo-hydrolase [Streptomyces fuscichromogenes]GGN19974.1 MBL fold metallo-hydrolase [Streptomyces fuscichromogenes]